jgi:DNA-binding GntR family transcriptional regulator
VETRAKTKRNCSATQTVYEELKRQILAFQILPGGALEEGQILRNLGFSRTPFREACMRLHEEGWLLAFSRRGFLVAPITFEDIAHIYELRLILESACAQIAADRATDADIAHLRRIVQVEVGRTLAEGISADLIRMNFEFHTYLAEMTRNTRLINIVRNTLEHVTRFDSMLTRHAPSTSWVPHGAIVEAIADCDPMRAGKSMQEHIEQARLRILGAFARESFKLSLPHLEYSPTSAPADGSGLKRAGREQKSTRRSLPRAQPYAVAVR